MRYLRFFKSQSLFAIATCLGVWVFGGQQVHAVVVTGGQATWEISNHLSPAVYPFRAYLDETATYDDALASGIPDPGNAPFTRPTEGTVRFQDPIRPYGVTPPATAGRVTQATTLDVDLGNILGTWGADEQIGFQNIQRWGLAPPYPDTQVITVGDVFLRYDSTSDGFGLYGNPFGTTDYHFANLANVSLVEDLVSHSFTLSGDIVFAPGIWSSFIYATPGEQIGTFSMTANLTAVPEPATFALLATGLGGGVARRYRRNLITQTAV